MSLVHAPSVAAVQVRDRRTVVLDLDARECLPRLLEGSAAAVWHAIDGRRRDHEVVAAVAREFEVPTDQIEVDVMRFLRELTEAGLLSEAP